MIYQNRIKIVSLRVQNTQIRLCKLRNPALNRPITCVLRIETRLNQCVKCSELQRVLTIFLTLL